MENKTSKYLKYAIGEIILVVIGILIALSINNWNEIKKKDETFKAITEQVYNVLDRESELLIQTNIGLQQQITLIDTLLNKPQRFDKKLLPSLLYYLEANPVDIKSEAAYQLGFLEFDPKNAQQSKISKSLSYFVNYDNFSFSKVQKSPLIPLLHNLNLPEPDVIFGYFGRNNYYVADLNFFNEAQQDKVAQSITNETFQNALKSIRSQKEGFMFKVSEIISEAEVNIKLIKTYDPSVRLFYTEIGLVGTALTTGWDDTQFMTLTNADLSIWEGDFLLTDGLAKFRCGNNWTDNWGGNTFPEGRTIYFGEDILVTAGHYHVILNLTDKTYQFKSITNN